MSSLGLFNLYFTLGSPRHIHTGIYSAGVSFNRRHPFLLASTRNEPARDCFIFWMSEHRVSCPELSNVYPLIKRLGSSKVADVKLDTAHPLWLGPDLEIVPVGVPLGI